MSEIPELDDNYEPTRWAEPVHFVPLLDKLADPHIIARLIELARGGIGEPTSHEQ